MLQNALASIQQATEQQLLAQQITGAAGCFLDT
jgi:hypothetical protein